MTVVRRVQCDVCAIVLREDVHNVPTVRAPVYVFDKVSLVKPDTDTERAKSIMLAKDETTTLRTFSLCVKCANERLPGVLVAETGMPVT